MRQLNIWDVLFYLSLLVITIWLILKSIGVIQTPFWLEYGLPIGGFIITLLTFYQNIFDRIGKLAVNLATLTTKFGHLEKDVSVLKKDVSVLKIDVDFLKRKVI